MMYRRLRLADRAPRGVTLLELLVTIGIILAITAAVIPVMAPAMAGRRLREASRGVNTFISSARNRAMVTGRPVGVAFERLPAEPQASMLLSMVEVPAPWSGDYATSRMVFSAKGRISDFTETEFGWLTAKLRQGDTLRLNNRSTSYRLYAGEVAVDLDGDGNIELGEFLDADGPGTTDGTYDGPGAALDNQQVYFDEQPNNSIWTLGYDDPRTQLQPLRLQPGLYSFQIIRQPVKSASVSYQLPVGTIVDLGVSGIDQGTYFAPLDDTDLSPVVLLFAPNGSVDRLWCRSEMEASKPLGSGSYTWKSTRPTSTVQFLIGRRDGIGLTVPPGETPDVIPNWFDLENLWVGVNSQTGAVFSNPNSTVFDVNNVQVDKPPVEGEEDDARALLDQARAFARQGQSMGGK